MSLLELPEVKSFIIGNTEGSLLRTENEPDGESIAAVMGFMWNTITEPGEMLGLGAPRYLSFQSSSQAYMVINTKQTKLVTISLAPSALTIQNKNKIIAKLENGE